MDINRRDFIKNIGLGCAVCSAGSWVPGSLAAMGQPEVRGAMTATASLCEMCSFRCPIQAQVVDKKSVFIQGNPNAKKQGTRICARGGSGVSLLNDPERIVQPMKRKGPRGSGEWEVISWDTAYQEIAHKLNTIKEQHGAESVVFSSKSGSLSGHLFHLAKAYGSPNTFTHVSTCPAGKYIAGAIMMGGDLSMDIANTRYMVSFGHNLYEGIEVADTQAMMAAQEAGAKVVSFDPRLSVFSSKADEWYAIRPAGDLPVLQAMCHILIKENLYDKAFIQNHTSGFEAFAASVADCTPEWAAKHSDVPADVILRITREIAAAAPHVIVNPGHRATYSQEEVDMRRVIFAANALLGCIERRGGMYQKKKAAFYNGLAGEIVAPVLASPGVKGIPEIKAKRIDEIDPQFKFISKSGGIVQQIIDAEKNSVPYPIKAWIMSRHNPLQTVASRPALVQTMERLDLVVSCDVYLSESASYADYLLPECTYLERDEEIADVSDLQPAYALRQQVVEIIGNSKPSWQIWREMGLALGLGAYFPWEDMHTRQLFQANGDVAFYRQMHNTGYVEYGIPLLLREPDSVAEFVKRYPAAKKALDADGTFSSQLKFKTPTKAMELSSPSLEAIAPGYTAPKFRDFPLKKPEQLYFIQGKVAVHTNGATQYVPMLAELMDDNPVWIHPETAKKHGINNGDKVTLQNDIGTEIGRALVTPGIRPDTVFVYMGGGAKTGAKTPATYRGIHCGSLLPHVVSPVCGTDVHTSGVSLKRA